MLRFSFPVFWLLVLLVAHAGLWTARPAVGAEWESIPGGRRLRLPVDAGLAPRSGFTEIPAASTGVTFTNELRGDLSLTNAVAHNGAGLAIGDVDGDGRPDLYFCNLHGPNQLYRNLGGWRFAPMDIGPAACADQMSTAAALVDLDADGDLDLLVNGIASGTRLFLNDGRGGWTAMSDSGLSRTASAMSMGLADIDGDGDLDLYCAHYIDVMHLADPTTKFAVAQRDGAWVVSKVNGEPTSLPRWKNRFEVLPGGRVRELPEVHGLYRNEGGGRFRAIESEPGTYLDETGKPIPPFRDWGLSAMFRDLNGDGAPDLYVANDNASPDRAWINTGRGTFRALESGKLRHTSRSSMALDFADIDRDGHDDLLVLDMFARSHAKRMTQLMKDYPDPLAAERPEDQPRYNRNTLFLGRADGSFVEAAYFAGVAATDWSWCPVFLDVDLDGYEDLLVSNGFSFDVMDQDSHDQLRGRRLTFDQQKRIRQFHPAWPTENVAFRNRRDGTFVPASRDWGFQHAGISYGMAAGDLDGDGDLDVVVNNLNEAPSLYRNEATAGRIAVRLKGLAGNGSGVGSRLRLTGGAVAQSQEMMVGGRYLSSDEAIRVFAAERGSGGSLTLEVRWRRGGRTVVPVAPDHLYEIAETSTDAPSAAARVGSGTSAGNAVATPSFRDVTESMGHVHVEDPDDDWARQPLLPRRLSRLGPGAAWADVNGDGWPDAVVGAARGGRLAVFVNEQGERFRRIDSAAPAVGDILSVVCAPDGKGGRTLIAAESAQEEAGGAATGSLAFWSVPKEPALRELGAVVRVSTGPSSPGVLALADVDGDGDLDLFVGGRHRLGRYPEPVSSAIWTHREGRWARDDEASKAFEGLGLVTGAAFADLDGDGGVDLVLATEWGPLRCFRNQRGRFVEVTEAWGLSAWTGWWNSVAVGDFDEDGRLDLVAGNWGRNSAYEICQPGPLRLYFGDFNNDGAVVPVETWQGPAGDLWPVRPRSWMVRSLPDLAQRFPTHAAFARADLRALLGDRFGRAQVLEARALDSAVFLRRDKGFERVVLPREVQLAPVFGVAVGDADGDGHQDLFFAQNFFGHGGDFSRDDAGRAGWLRGTGSGEFARLEAGIRIEGEQRAAALSDFDRDGRLDLLVTQSGGPTRVFQNVGGRAGWRVILAGPAANPEGIGASLRVRYTDGSFGPRQVVSGAGGYGSRDAGVTVVGLAGGREPESLQVTWPGGATQTLALKGKPGEIRVEARAATP